MYYAADKNNVKEEIRNSDNYTLIEGNLCSIDLINHILNEHSIDLVIHFAAQSHVQDSFSDSLKYTKDNILGTHVLLECCRLYGKIERFIHVSTDEVYGESMNEVTKTKTEQKYIVSNQSLCGTKAGAELIAQS